MTDFETSVCASRTCGREYDPMNPGAGEGFCSVQCRYEQERYEGKQADPVREAKRILLKEKRRAAYYAAKRNNIGAIKE